MKLKAINCPVCDGKGQIYTEKTTTRYPDGSVEVMELEIKCPNPSCNDGVILIEINEKD